MRLIDADAFLSNYKGNILTAQTDYAQGARDIIEDMLDAPTVDAVPVVICKDCRRKRYCEWYSTNGCDENNFCSYGERKDD